jgi:hypothetical protein
MGNAALGSPVGFLLRLHAGQVSGRGEKRLDTIASMVMPLRDRSTWTCDDRGRLLPSVAVTLVPLLVAILDFTIKSCACG